MRIAAQGMGRPNLLAWPADRIQDRNLKLFTATNSCLFALMAVVAVWAAWQRGPWLDEFWTLWLSRHDVPLMAAVRERWLIDVHPPFFTGMNWLVQTWAGNSIVARRLMNFLPLVASLLLTTTLCRRYPNNRKYIIICAFKACSHPVAQVQS